MTTNTPLNARPGANCGYIELEDGKLYYETAGEGKAVVLLHAGIVDSGMWGDQWGALAQRFRAIRYDMRGFGQSDALQESVSQRRELQRLLQQLGIQRASLVGCSLGGEVALDFALEHPETVESLVLVSAVPSGFALQGEPPQHILEMIEAMQQGEMERASDLQIRVAVDGPFREPEQVDPAVRQRATAMNRQALAGGGWPEAVEQIDPLDPPAVGRLGEVRAPVLIMAGALDHPEILRAAEQMAAGIGGAQKVILADTAHLPNMEKPAEFNEAVNGFLQAD